MNPSLSRWLHQHPFVCPLVSLITGILSGALFQFNLVLLVSSSCIVFISLFLFGWLPVYVRFRFGWIRSLLLLFLFVLAGIVLVLMKDSRSRKDWYGKLIQPGDQLVAVIDEAPVEKPKTIKAIAAVQYLLRGNQQIPVSGNILLYFRKDSTAIVSYGNRILLRKQPDPLRNPGNPASFDYRQYLLRQGITGQEFIQPKDWRLLDTTSGKALRQFFINSRTAITALLRKTIPGKKEQGLAEAMLIGYKNDLDPTLLHAYANTGVVHIIAISGLHLGLIYWLLGLILRPLQRFKKIAWLRALLLLAGLWSFSLLAGAQPSVLRSAVMFSFIVVGEMLGRQSSIVNTLALSAFFLLCINPYWLWDAGFQLSYAAVLSLILFMQPIYRLLYIRWKWLDYIWKMNAVTLAAQVLTIPISIYHFHQFPNYFLFTNLIAVPLSSLVVLAEILICVLPFAPSLAAATGKLTGWLIQLLNSCIEWASRLPFALWEGLYISAVQTWLLYSVIACGAWGIQFRKKSLLVAGLLCLLATGLLRIASFSAAMEQEELVVYNIPGTAAMDIFNGRTAVYYGDTLSAEAMVYTLNPSRRSHRLKDIYSSSSNGAVQFIRAGNKKIIKASAPAIFHENDIRPAVDILLLSKNPNIRIADCSKAFSLQQVVIDASVPARMSRKIKQECISAGIACTDVKEDGAFVMRLR